MSHGILLILFSFVCGMQAREAVEEASMAEAVTHEEHPGLSPAVEQKHAQFFGKDFPWDKRPKVDVLHFKHPYPAVQDSQDFDSDYIKDENSDDGSWKAQSEYDRLRHKLAVEKSKISKVLAAKNQAEDELQQAMHREEVAKKKVVIKAKVQVPGGQSSHGDPTPAPRRVTRAPPRVAGGIASPGDVKIATSDTQRAMDQLEACKKELAEARERLKKLMEQLEAAKKEQRDTQAAYEAAVAEQKKSGISYESEKVTVKGQYQQYMDSREEYLKQLALVAKMEQDIKVAAASVKATRDGEDKGGGVYNTGDRGSRSPFKGAARSLVSPLLAFALIGFATVASIAY